MVLRAGQLAVSWGANLAAVDHHLGDLWQESFICSSGSIGTHMKKLPLKLCNNHLIITNRRSNLSIQYWIREVLIHYRKSMPKKSWKNARRPPLNPGNMFALSKVIRHYFHFLVENHYYFLLRLWQKLYQKLSFESTRSNSHWGATFCMQLLRLEVLAEGRIESAY